MATNPTQQAYDNWQAAKTPWYRQATPTSLAKEREAEQAYTNALRNPQSPVKFGGQPGAGPAASVAEPSTAGTPASPKQSLATLAGEPSAAATGAGRGTVNPPTVGASKPLLEAARQQDWSRQGMTNAQVAQANPEGRVQFERQPNGVASFSGSNVSGPVSYTNGAGTPLAGAGIDGRGFGGFDSAPAGAKVAIGEGGYAFGSSAAPSAPAGQSQSPVGMSPAQAQQQGLIGERIGYNPAYDQRLGAAGQPSAQNMAAADQLAANQQMDSISRVATSGNVPQSPPQGLIGRVTATHSGNDWTAREMLRRQKMDANSLIHQSNWAKKGSGQAAQKAYGEALQDDYAAMTGGQTGADVEVMRQNAGLQREGMQQDGADRRDARRSLIDAARLGQDGQRLSMERETQQIQNRPRSLIASLQEQIAAEQDSTRRDSLVQRMRDIEGKGADVDPYLVVPGGQQTNSEGQVYTAPSSVFNRRSGTYLQQPGAKAQLPSGMSRQVGTSGGKPVYEDSSGNRFIGN